MNQFKKIVSFAVIVTICAASFVGTSSCHVYKFNEATIPDSIKTVKIDFIENHARYINPQLSQQLTDRLRQKIVGQTKLTQTNSENFDWEIGGYISQYDFSTSAISQQQVTNNRLTVGVHITLNDTKSGKKTDYDVARSFEFKGDLSFQQAEQTLGDEIVRTIA
ncbi:MAG TPA: LPS assembly lipoprotein LptE, partial [Chitinophagaceae bacterium]|nr:LPS assembly lipoprotein LptE [Chitinophagaceae bacterium]